MEDLQIHRILAIPYASNLEDRELLEKKMHRAAGGAFPFLIREMMKQHAREILASTTANDQERENAKLLICYSRWAKALEDGIEKEHFQEFMWDQLNRLDQDPLPGSS